MSTVKLLKFASIILISYSRLIFHIALGFEFYARCDELVFRLISFPLPWFWIAHLLESDQRNEGSKSPCRYATLKLLWLKIWLSDLSLVCDCCRHLHWSCAISPHVMQQQLCGLMTQVSPWQKFVTLELVLVLFNSHLNDILILHGLKQYTITFHRWILFPCGKEVQCHLLSYCDLAQWYIILKVIVSKVLMLQWWYCTAVFKINFFSLVWSSLS